MTKTFDIEIDCPNCALKCERAIKNLEGVEDCTISFITQKMTLVADDVDKVLDQVIKTGRKIDIDFDVKVLVC